MNTKHTPGPWKVSTTYKDAQAGKFSIAPWASQRQSICRLSAREDYPAEYAEANARLIAAAPDLLETLENIRSAAFGSAKATAGDATRAAEALTTLGEWAAEAITKATTQQ